MTKMTAGRNTSITAFKFVSSFNCVQDRLKSVKHISYLPSTTLGTGFEAYVVLRIAGNI